MTLEMTKYAIATKSALIGAAARPTRIAGTAPMKGPMYGIGQAQYPARDAGQDSDHPGDDQLAAHVRVQHLADAAPDLVEVGAVVGGHETPKRPLDGCSVEREEERDDERKQELEKRCERS